MLSGFLVNSFEHREQQNRKEEGVILINVEAKLWSVKPGEHLEIQNEHPLLFNSCIPIDICLGCS